MANTFQGIWFGLVSPQGPGETLNAQFPLLVLKAYTKAFVDVRFTASFIWATGATWLSLSFLAPANEVL